MRRARDANSTLKNKYAANARKAGTASVDDAARRVDLDGSVTSTDLGVWNANNGATLDWDALSDDPDDGLGNRIGYAGYQHDSALAASWTLYHVRHPVLNANLGRWTRHDLIGYVNGMSCRETECGDCEAIATGGAEHETDDYFLAEGLIQASASGRTANCRVTTVTIFSVKGVTSGQFANKVKRIGGGITVDAPDKAEVVKSTREYVFECIKVEG